MSHLDIHPHWKSGEQIDREVVAEMEPCEHCHQSYHYEAERNPGSYRCFAVCGCERIEF